MINEGSSEAVDSMWVRWQNYVKRSPQRCKCCVLQFYITNLIQSLSLLWAVKRNKIVWVLAISRTLFVLIAYAQNPQQNWESNDRLLFFFLLEMVFVRKFSFQLCLYLLRLAVFIELYFESELSSGAKFPASPTYCLFFAKKPTSYCFQSRESNYFSAYRTHLT